jgi:hypothetical protein
MSRVEVSRQQQHRSADPGFRRAGGERPVGLPLHQETRPAPIAERLVAAACRRVRDTHPFKLPAIVVLPDHLRCLRELPFEDTDPVLGFALRALPSLRSDHSHSIVAGGLPLMS